GDPGVGKSQLALALAATVSSGKTWPACANAAVPGNVIVISAEDDAGDTVVPRLHAADADLDKVLILDAVGTEAGSSTFNLDRDLNRLAATVRSIGNVSLIIIDPISAYLGKADANNMGDVRAILARLAQFAESFEACILAISHLNKDAKKKATYRVTGS